MDGFLPFRLSVPVTLETNSAEGFSAETIDTVTLRDVTGADLLLLDQYGTQPMRLMLELVSALTGLPMVAVRKMSSRDLGPLGDTVFGMLPDGLSTGATA